MGVKGHKGGKWQNQWHLSCCSPYFSFLHVLVSCRPPRHSFAPRLLFLIPSPYRFFSLSLVLSSLFDIFWHRLLYIQTLRQKRAWKRDRWRDESRRSRRQMDGVQEDGRRRKEQSLLFLAAGASCFVLLYNWYSLYITISLLTLNQSWNSGLSSNTWILLCHSAAL